MNRCIAAVSAGFGVACLWAAPAAAITLTGNPVLDGWTRVGNSLTVGTYIRDSGEVPLDYNYDVYRIDTVLTANSGTFLAGDRVIGLGGFCNGQIGGGTIDNNCAINALAKFGGPAETFAAASSYPGTDGRGSDAQGGIGTVNVRIQLGGSTAAVNYYDGVDADGLTPVTDFGGFVRFAAVTEQGLYTRSPPNCQAPNFCTTDRIRSWEVLLSLDGLTRAGFAVTPLQTGDGNVVMQGQRPGGFHFVDALAPSSLGIAAVPEPATWAMMALGFGLVGGFARRAAARPARA